MSSLSKLQECLSAAGKLHRTCTLHRYSNRYNRFLIIMKWIQLLRDWSEVWALLIPLIIILIYRPKGKNVSLLIIYVILAFILNFFAIWMVEFYYWVPSWMTKGNNVFYNIHSFIMVILFGWYIIRVRSYKNVHIMRFILFAYVAFVLLNFILRDSPLLLSTRHFTVGSTVLLLMCLFYFFRTIMEESRINWLRHPSFIICTAVCLYQAITFFIFLFIYPLFDETYNRDLSFAMLMMRVYQIIFVIFCILLAIGLFQYRKRKKSPVNE